MTRWMIMKYFIKVLSTPSCWVSNHRTSKEVTAKLRMNLAFFDFDSIEPYRARINDSWYWIENHPYASFQPLKEDSFVSSQYRLPDRITRLYAYDRLMQAKEKLNVKN